MNENQIFRSCGSCKKPIGFSQKYLACSVSTCKKSAYCSMPCFDAHSPVFRHKDAWAEEKLAPKVAEEIVVRRVVSAPSATTQATGDLPMDTLIVASKLKDYVKAKSGMNTSASVLKRLSDMVRILCDKAVDNAAKDQRKTLMDRDFSL